MTGNTARLRRFLILLCVFAVFSSAPLSNATAQSQGFKVFIPSVYRASEPTPTPTRPPAPTPTLPPNAPTATPIQPTPISPGAPYTVRVNMPYFADNAANHNDEAAVFWFGQVGQNQNYADIRLAYDSQKLWVYVAAIDQYLWFDSSPSASELTQYDGASLYLNLNGNTGSSLSAQSYRFDAALYPTSESSANYKAAYRWQNGQWVAGNLPFTNFSAWRGSRLLGGVKEGRGWAVAFTIPFSTLGVNAPTAGSGASWGVSVVMHDRDGNNANNIQPDQAWPAGVNLNSPSSWAMLYFGLTDSGQRTGNIAGTVLIRRPSQNSSAVPDASVGSGTSHQCPGDEYDLFGQWGNQNFGRTGENIVQNQSDIADWPCFAKYYVSFGLDSVPAGKTILSARLILHQQGHTGDINGDPARRPRPSWIQVFTVSPSWQETSITWNNAPPAIENVSLLWVDPRTSYGDWPKLERSWDVTNAAIRAYQDGQPLSLALYSADTEYSSGKYFTASDTGDWNTAGRPALEIKWANP